MNDHDFGENRTTTPLGNGDDSLNRAIVVPEAEQVSVQTGRKAAFVFGLVLIACCLMLVIQWVNQSLTFSSIRLYFADFSFHRLVPSQRNVRTPSGTLKKLKTVVDELIAGPVSNDTLPAIPGTTRLRGHWISGNTAFLDFSRQLFLDLPDNADAEIVAVYAIVNTVVENVPGISKVQILVEGVPVRTLRGLTRVLTPLTPRRDLVKKGG